MISFQGALTPGDIIVIGKKPACLLVVESKHVVDHDMLRGDSYSVDQIHVIEIAKDVHSLPLRNPGAHRATLDYINPKILSFYMKGGSMSGEGKEIDPTSVTVIGTSKLQVEVSTTYSLFSPKYY